MDVVALELFVSVDINRLVFELYAIYHISGVSLHVPVGVISLAILDFKKQAFPRLRWTTSHTHEESRQHSLSR